MDLKVNNNLVNFTGKRTKSENLVGKTVHGAVSGAVLGAGIQAGYLGFQLIKNSKSMTLSQAKDLIKPSLGTIKSNAIACAILNGALALGFGVYDIIKNKKS